jgi:hypothetical protein
MAKMATTPDDMGDMLPPWQNLLLPASRRRGAVTGCVNRLAAERQASSSYGKFFLTVGIREAEAMCGVLEPLLREATTHFPDAPPLEDMMAEDPVRGFPSTPALRVNLADKAAKADKGAPVAVGMMDPSVHSALQTNQGRAEFLVAYAEALPRHLGEAIRAVERHRSVAPWAGCLRASIVPMEGERDTLASGA